MLVLDFKVNNALQSFFLHSWLYLFFLLKFEISICIILKRKCFSKRLKDLWKFGLLFIDKEPKGLIV